MKRREREEKRREQIKEREIYRKLSFLSIKAKLYENCQDLPEDIQQAVDEHFWELLL